jgi:hypothetical protein
MLTHPAKDGERGVSTPRFMIAAGFYENGIYQKEVL